MEKNTAAGKDSRARMLEAAITLMRGTGLSGAGINEIVRESGAPKGSVYHFFPEGKMSLAAQALAAYALQARGFIEDALASRVEPDQKVRALFEAFAKRVEAGNFKKSCAVGAVSLDLDEDSAALRGTLADAFAQWIDCIVPHFDLGDGPRTRSFAGLVLTALEGAYIRCRAEQSSLPFTEAGEWLAWLVQPTSAPRSRTSPNRSAQRRQPGNARTKGGATQPTKR